MWYADRRRSFGPGPIGWYTLVANIGAVEQVDAGVHGSIHDGKAGRLIGKLAEVHGAKAQPADLQARAAQRGIVHGELLQE
ncbi:hypothetical protein G6F53_013879 [Rhizopus delemar]|nr:hypothetical protein G6F53_013879 [Rhizopus delemar]